MWNGTPQYLIAMLVLGARSQVPEQPYGGGNVLLPHLLVSIQVLGLHQAPGERYTQRRCVPGFVEGGDQEAPGVRADAQPILRRCHSAIDHRLEFTTQLDIDRSD